MIIPRNQKPGYRNQKKNCLFFSNLVSGFWFLVSLFLSGCATTLPPSVHQQVTPVVYKPTVPEMEGLGGFYHRLEKGQTLWRISQMYGVDIDELIRINNILDASQLRLGQAIYIPKSIEAASLPQAAQGNIEQDFIWPLKGKVVSNFGDKSASMLNKGINLRVFSDSAVIAPNSGMVIFTSDMLKGYGLTLIMEHSNGFMTVYCLLSEILVKPGDYINQGMPIGKVNNNGILHFEIRKRGIAQNPYYYLPR